MFTRSTLPTLIAVLSLALTIAGSAVADLEQDAQALEDDINALVGTEFAGLSSSFSLAQIGVDVTATLQGVGFCTPPDPTALPDPTPTPPNNAYGCVNGAMVDATEVPTTIQAAVVVTLSELFIDFSLERDESFLCGEFGTGTVSSGAYALTDAVFEFTISVESLPQCTRRTIVPGSVSLTVGSYEITFEDECVAGFASLFTALVASTLTPELESAFGDGIAEYFDELNREECGEVAIEASNWTVLKTRY